MSGAGAAGTAILKLLLEAGVKHAVVADIHGVVHAGREDLVDAAPDSPLRWIADNTNPEGVTGTLKEAVVGADVFIGVSAPNVLDGSDVAAMAEGAIVFALANPDPEVDPAVAARDGGRRRHRPLRLPEPDQQRAGLPGRLPRSAGRPVPHRQHGDDARRRARPGRRRRARTR